tara:strand:+ start:34 stop:144 length:111 start_codon:yes stop_codon:yes gene_type:complete
MMVGLGFLALFPDSLFLPEKVCGVPILVLQGVFKYL